MTDNFEKLDADWLWADPVVGFCLGRLQQSTKDAALLCIEVQRRRGGGLTLEETRRLAELVGVTCPPELVTQVESSGC